MSGTDGGLGGGGSGRPPSLPARRGESRGEVVRRWSRAEARGGEGFVSSAESVAGFKGGAGTASRLRAVISRARPQTDRRNRHHVSGTVSDCAIQLMPSTPPRSLRPPPQSATLTIPCLVPLPSSCAFSMYSSLSLSL